MITGIGMDAVDIRRIEAVLARRGDAFLARCLTDGERADAAAIAHERTRHARIAKVIAAKEAAVKALGTGFRDGIGWPMIAVSRGAYNQPVIALLARAQARAQALCEGGTPHIHLTLSDEYPYAYAYVVLEKR